MSQYKTGTVSVTNGSATVTGSGTSWSTEIAAGQWFGVDGDGVTYQVSVVNSNTQLTLSTNYAGTTGSGKTYFIVRDYTSPDNIPILAPNDIATATVMARAVNKIQSLFSVWSKGAFYKADPTIVAFTKTGNFTVSAATIIYVEVNGSLKTIAASTAVTMPSATVGTDYAIWAKTDGTLEATSNHTTPPTANARKIGGFHYAPGGNAPAQAGGDSTPSINAYSFWDLKYRPAVADPRGLTRIANGKWAFIYFLGVDHIANGPSTYAVTIADGSSPPKIPTAFGGNGTTAYANGNWWSMAEVLRAYGFSLPTYSEFAAMAYGVTEATSRGTDPVTTGLDAARTSKWGTMQATGNLYTWGDEFGGGAAAAAWVTNTEGRGSTYQMENSVLFGGYWGGAANSGSRCSAWSPAPTVSDGSFGARGVCDHLQLD